MYATADVKDNKLANTLVPMAVDDLSDAQNMTCELYSDDNGDVQNFSSND